MKKTNSILITAAVLSLLSTPGVKAGNDLSFDAMRSGLSVTSINGMIKGDNKVPTPSTYTPTTELTNFWGKLTDNTKDQVCKAANLKINQSAKLIPQVGISGGLKREFKSYPDQRLALIDEVDLKLNAALGTELLNVPNMGALSVSVSGGVDGKSVVVRPLENNSYCKNLGMLAKLYDVKSVLPMSAKRISAMETGEIWKLPVVVQYSFGASAGASFNGIVNVSIGASETKQRKPTISLYKMDANNIRVRLRVDHVTVKNVGAAAGTFDIPAGDIGVMSGENLIANTVNRTVAAQINKFIAFKLGYNYYRIGGQKLLLEFMVNPNDPEQVAKLAEFVKGNLGTIEQFVKLGLRFDQFSEDEDSQSGVEEINDLAAEAGSAVGAPNTFAGADHYDTHGHNMNVTIPVVHSHQTNWTTTYHRYQALSNDGGTTHVQQRTRESNEGSLSIPFAGTRIKYNSKKDVYVVNQEGKDGTVSKPVLLYQKYEGFVRQGDPTARYMLENANNVLKYAGMHGNGVNLNNTLPAADIFPPLPPQETELPAVGDMQQDPTKTYRSALMSFKLVFAEQAVQDIVFAPEQDIMKAFMNVMRETEGAIVDKVMDLFTVNKKGEATYDQKAMRQRLGAGYKNMDNGTNPLEIVNTLASAATQFLGKIASVRAESTWKGQSEQLAKVAATGDMKYEDFLKVVIQLVDVKNISSDIYVHTDKRVKGEADITQNYTMFNTRENGFDNTISDVNQMRERFADPGDLTD